MKGAQNHIIILFTLVRRILKNQHSRFVEIFRAESVHVDEQVKCLLKRRTLKKDGDRCILDALIEDKINPRKLSKDIEYILHLGFLELEGNRLARFQAQLITFQLALAQLDNLFKSSLIFTVFRRQLGGLDILSMGILQLVLLLELTPLLECQLGIFVSGRDLDLLHEAPLGRVNTLCGLKFSQRIDMIPFGHQIHPLLKTLIGRFLASFQKSNPRLIDRWIVFKGLCIAIHCLLEFPIRLKFFSTLE